MKVNKWTLGLAAAGVVSLGSVVQAEEATETVKTFVSSTTISGYVNTSAHWNPGSRAGTTEYTFGAAGKSDGFNLDVVDLTISKPLDEGEWSAGYKAELWLGPDANALGTTSTGFGTFQDFAVRNAYVALRAPVGNGLDFKFGVWDTIIGYEGQNSHDNPNYTHSWGHTIEPTQHTGVLASYRLTDAIAISVGVANTTDAVINGRAGASSQKTYMGGITLTAPDTMGFLAGGTLSAGVVDGRSSAVPGGPDTTWYYIGGALPTPIEGLILGAAYDLVDAAGGDAMAIGAYISFAATEKLKLNLRGEYFDGGSTVNPALGFGTSTEIATGTATLDYSLWENVISRLEYRYDRDLSGRKSLGATGGDANNNTHLLALNVIYKF